MGFAITAHQVRAKQIDSAILSSVIENGLDVNPVRCMLHWVKKAFFLRHSGSITRFEFTPKKKREMSRIK